MAKTLLQEAIAEAKQVREAALKNATKQLEESLTPSIKEALAQKLEEDVDLEECGDEESLEESSLSGFKEVKQPKKAVNEAEDEDEDDSKEEKPEDDSEAGNEEGADVDDSKEGDEEGSEEPADSDEKPEDSEEGEDDDDKKLSDLTVGELRDIIQDMVAAATVPAPGGNEGVDLETGNVEGTGEEAPLGDLQSADSGEAEQTPESEEGAEDDGDEEIDLSEILKELEEEDSDLNESDTAGTLKDPKPQADKKPGNNQSRQDQTDKELAEARRVIRGLKNTLAEVNLLNSKLVCTTKMLKRDLTESQKAEVITAFDEAKSPREVKVVYRTLQESLRPAKKRTVVESRQRAFASRTAGNSTAARTIVESNDMVRRFQQLAGIIE